MRSIAVHAGIAALMYYTALSLFVPAAFIHSGLRNGRRAAWITIGAASIVLLVAVPPLAPATQLAATLANLSRFIFEIGIPAGIATMLVARQAPFGLVLLTALGGSFAGFFVTEFGLRGLMNYSPYETIVGNFRAIAEAATAVYRNQGWPAESIQAMETITRVVSGSFMPALLACTTALMFVLSLIMVARLPAGRETGTRYLFRNLSLPEPLLFAFVAGGLSPLASGAVRIAGLNLLAIVGFLYLLQGLAVVRAMLLQFGFGPIATFISYAVLALFMLYGVAPLALAIVGLFDSFFDFRKLNRKDSTDESDSD